MQITYRILARLVYNRIRERLDVKQSEDQYGFRKGRSCIHALLVMESMIAKGIEYNIPVWIVSIDLKKAFDRINHEALFKALADQNLDDEHIALLQCLYKHQRGIVGEYDFDIIRGVRQGDVLSPLLFNAVLEHAIVKWKQQLSDEGFALIPNWTVSRLTNIRYADDLLLFGQSLDEAVSMLEKLASIL